MKERARATVATASSEDTEILPVKIGRGDVVIDTSDDVDRCIGRRSNYVRQILTKARRMAGRAGCPETLSFAPYEIRSG